MKLISTFVLLLSLQFSNAQVVINEVLFNAINGDGIAGSNGEWIEIYNSSEVAIDIGDWFVSDGDWTLIFNAGTTIASGDYLIIGNAATAESPVVDIDVNTHTLIGSGAITLTNTSEFVTLYNDASTLVDGVEWGNSTDTTIPNPSGGADIIIDISTLDSAPTNEADGESISRNVDGTGSFVLSDDLNGNTPGAGNIVLPIELAFFEIRKSDVGVEISWSTISESNNAFFFVEHSADGIDFRILVEIEAAGTTTETEKYSHLDRNPISGKNYYRLRQVDLSSRFSISETKLVEIDPEGSMAVYPTMTSDYSTIIFSKKLRKQITIKLFDSMGKLVLVQNLNKGLNRTTLNLTNLSKGMYFLKSDLDNWTGNNKILISH